MSIGSASDRSDRSEKMSVMRFSAPACHCGTMSYSVKLATEIVTAEMLVCNNNFFVFDSLSKYCTRTDGTVLHVQRERSIPVQECQHR